MLKKLFMLFKIGRKLSTTGAISSIYEIYNPPIIIKILFFIIGFNLHDLVIILVISCFLIFYIGFEIVEYLGNIEYFVSGE